MFTSTLGLQANFSEFKEFGVKLRRGNYHGFTKSEDRLDNLPFYFNYVNTICKMSIRSVFF